MNVLHMCLVHGIVNRDMKCNNLDCTNKATKGKVTIRGLCDCKGPTLFTNQFCKQCTDNPADITHLRKLVLNPDWVVNG